MEECDTDDIPTLPADTLAILQQFQQEQLERLKKLESGVENKDRQADEIEIEEDWVSLSQCLLG